MIFSDHSIIHVLTLLVIVAGKLKLFMRSPTWISPPFGGNVLQNEVKKGEEGDITHRQYYFSDKEKEDFKDNPMDHLLFRQKIEAEINLLFPFYTRGTDLQKQMHVAMNDEMQRRLGPGQEKLKVRNKKIMKIISFHTDIESTRNG